MASERPLGRWLLSQIELMPLHLLREGPGMRLQQRWIGRMMGESEAKELYALLNRPPDGQERAATVLLPGIMGSLLASVRGICSLIWLNPTVLLNGEVNLLDLDGAGSGDASPDVEIVPIGIEKLVYLKLVLALAHRSRLYEFPYDWRRRLEDSADALHVALSRWSSAEPSRRFVLVGHSMGGMVARTYLSLYPEEAERRIERLVLIGSPAYGSPLVAQLLAGTSIESQIVSRLHEGNDVTGFARNLPSVYQLLPPPPELFDKDRAYPMGWDIYDAKAWGGIRVRQDYLDHALAWHRRMARSDPQLPILQIAGCHRHTLTDVALGEAQDEGVPELELVHQDSGDDSGDNRVPLWSSRHDGWDTYYVEEDHQTLPRNQRVIEAVLAATRGEPLGLSRELPEPSVRLTELATRPVKERVAQLRQRIEAGALLGEDLDELFFAD